MRIAYFKTLWGHQGSLSEAIDQARAARFDGIEGPAPQAPEDKDEFRARLDAHRMDYIAEVTTGGGYVPNPRRSPAEHLEDLRVGIERSLEHRPLFVNTQAGLDAWPLDIQIDFHRRVAELQSAFGIAITVETHRSRSTYNPWTTAAIARAVPDLRLNLDFSHWCVVAERLVMNDDPELLSLFASRCGHMHARVGYDQGPQVPHPAAPEHQRDLEAHLAWWISLVRAAAAAGRSQFTITPEFGPDGYLHRLPFTGAPVADLWEVNVWIKHLLAHRLPVAGDGQDTRIS